MQVWDVTAEYSRFEAWAYDTFTAPALTGWIADHLLEDILDPVPRGGRVLDVGCGGGQLPLAIKDNRPDLEVTGLDLSSQQVRRAGQRAQKQKKDVSFLRGNALSLPFRPNSFDLVVSVGSIKHWPDRRAGLSECLRVLRPDSDLHVLEADPAVSWGDARDFIAGLNFPAVMRLPFLPYFKYVVAGNGLDESDTRALCSRINATDSTTRSLTNVPLVHTRTTP